MFGKYIVSLILAASASWYCSVALAEKVFRFANGNEIESLDPALIDGSPATLVGRAIFDGLVTPDPKTGDPLPGLAASWELSKDGKIYTFHLRKDAKWSNGRKVTAHDFAFAWKRILEPETGAYYQKKFYFMVGAEDYYKEKEKSKRDFSKVGIKAKNDETLVVTLKRPCPYFLEVMMHPVFFPVAREAVEKSPKDWAKPGKLVGNGPFLLAEWRIKDKIVLTRNASYWDAKQVKLDKIQAFPIENSKTALDMYRAGDLDWIRDIPPASIMSLKGNSEFHAPKQLGLMYLRFNTTRGALKDARVRRALSLAIDRNLLVEKVTKEGQTPALNFVSDGLKGYKAEVSLKENVAEAKKLLAEAGYPNGKGFPEMNLLFISNDQSKLVATAISSILKKSLNINLSPTNLERGVYYEKLDGLDYDIARSTWTGEYNDAETYLDKFVGANTYQNLTGYKSAAYDKLIEEASATIEPVKRNQLFAKAERLLILDDAVVAPIYQSVAVHLIKSYVKGIYPNNVSVHPLKAVDVVK